MKNPNFKDKISLGEVPWLSWELLALAGENPNFIMPIFSDEFYSWEIIVNNENNENNIYI